MFNRSCGLAAKAAPLQGDDRWFESTQDYSGPDTPTGRAIRLKPGCLQVRVLFWAQIREYFCSLFYLLSITYNFINVEYTSKVRMRYQKITLEIHNLCQPCYARSITRVVMSYAVMLTSHCGLDVLRWPNGAVQKVFYTSK